MSVSGSISSGYSSPLPRPNRGETGDAAGEGTLIIDLRALLSNLWARKPFVIAPALALGGVAFVRLALVEPTYRSTALVLVSQQRINVTDFQDLLSGSDSGAKQLANEVESLGSRDLLTQVVQELGLADDPAFVPVPALDESERSILDRVRGLLSDVPDTAAVPEDRLRLASAVGTLQDNLSLAAVPASSVIEISYVSDSPELSARIVNAVVEQYFVEQRQLKIGVAGTATEWLTARVDELRQQVQASEEAVENLRQQLASSGGQGLQITQQQLAALNTELSAARAQAAAAEGRFLRLSQSFEAGEDLSAESEAIREYRDRESALVLRRDGLSPRHPAISIIDSELAAVRASIKAEERRMVDAANLDLQAARTKVDELDRGVKQLEDGSLTQSRQEIQLRQLEREAQANQSIYEAFLSRLTEASEQDALQSADARVLSLADVPVDPVPLRKPQVIAVAALLGGLLGVAFLVMREILDNSFRSPRRIEAATGLPVLALLPWLRDKRDTDVIGHLRRNPGSSLAEAVRNLRTSIFAADGARPPRVVMFTSSVPNEGKSTASLLAALTCRQMGKSTIIVDCDLRIPSIMPFLGLPDDRPGLLSLLHGSATLEAAIHTDPASGLDVLGIGRDANAAPESWNAADLLSSQAFTDLVRHLSRTYEVVILDTPPTLVVADARVVSALADAVIYVVCWGATPRDAVIEGLGELASVRAPVLGTILTMVDERLASRTVLDGYTLHRGRYPTYYAT